MPEITVDVPAIGLLGHDRITSIREGDHPAQEVDWLVTHLRDHACPEHAVKHATIEYEIGAGEDRTSAEHCFEQSDTWLTVHRTVNALSDTSLPAVLAEAC